MENELISGMIISADKCKFIDKNTGEITYKTKIRYCMPKEQTDNYLGFAELDSYNDEKAFDIIKKESLCGKMIDIELKKQVDGNRLKLKICGINDHVLS